VRRDEVLLHGEAFAEVRRDRRLDDLPRRLGHEAAHAGELPDLLLRSARAGVGHDVHRVEAPPVRSISAISPNISSAIFSVTSDQTAMILL
jgi:hypothetical protein